MSNDRQPCPPSATGGAGPRGILRPCFTNAGRSRRPLLLAGVSLAALLIAGTPAAADMRANRSSSSATAAAASAATTAAQAAQAAAAQAMTRVDASLRSMRAIQAAAQAAARAASVTVPNGLTPGGLVVAPGAVPGPADGGSGLWQGANLPTQTTTSGRTQVEVVQTEKKAILTWESFNVGRETDLYFNQTAGGADVANWIALNRVLDPTAAPSRILGSIKADGQVYIVNRNGIIFGGSSQVNVGSLVVSSLALSNAQFLAGINTSLVGEIAGNSIDRLPTFGELAQTTDPSAPPPAAAGDVLVEAGAEIASGQHGLIGLFGTNVTNRGTITTDGGQVLMAAGERIFLLPHDADTGMIGLRAYVSAATGYYTGYVDDAAYYAALAARTAEVGMVVRNDGLITADGGNVTLVGSTVAQNGIVRAVTTLESPGSIFLAGEDSVLWNYYGTIKRRAGTVVFGEDSITQVVVDRSGELGTGGSDGNSSTVRIVGQTVELKGKTSAAQHELQGAYVQAEAGTIDIDLRGIELVYANLNEGFPVSPNEPMTGTRLLMQSGSVLDVAGAKDVVVPMERNSVAVEVRANEVRDAPLQRDGILIGETVHVDRRVSGKRADGSVWYGSEVVDANDYIANAPSSMAERAVAGGSVTVHAAEVVVASGATIDISGGSIRYLDGVVRTTQLTGIDGKRYDIGNAPADMIYVAVGDGRVVSHGRWSITETWTNSFRRSTSSVAEKGYVEGTTGGSLSVYAPTVVLDGTIDAHAVAGERQIVSPPAGGTLKIGSTSLPDSNFNAENVYFRAAAPALADVTATSPLPAERAGTVVLSTDMLSDSGLAKIEVQVRGDVTFDHDVDLLLSPGASLIVVSGGAGRSVVVDGSIRIPGGSVGITGTGATTLRAGTVIDVSGLWTNQLLAPSSGPVAVDGGTIDLGGALVFEPGVVLDVSAGARLTYGGDVEIGTAGTIQLGVTDAAGLDLDLVTLRGYGVTSGEGALASTGGKLILRVPDVVVAADGGATGGATWLDPSFFETGGFTTYVVRADTITIADGLTLAPAPQTRVLDGSFRWQASGDVAAVTSPTTPAPELRAGSALTFQAAGDLVLPSGSTLAPGVGGSVALSGATVTVAGTIDTPAGTVTLSGDDVTLAATGRLLARGATRIVTDALGHRSGEVLAGGEVDILAEGFVALEEGSLIDVSGVSGTIDVVDAGAGARPAYRPLTLAGDAGGITITASGGTIAGTLRGEPGGAGASGGTLSISMTASGDPSLPAPRTMLEQFLLMLEPGCYGYGDGSCDGDSQEAIGFDFGPMFQDFGLIGDGTDFPYMSLVFTQALYDALSPTSTGGIVFSQTAAGGGPMDLASYGITPEFIAVMEYGIDSSFGQVFRPVSPLVVRPSSFQSGGFATIAAAGANIELDGVTLSATRSITLDGALINRNGTSSRIEAPYIQLGGSGLTADPAAALAGQLTLAASLLDVGRVDLRGWSQTRIETDDLRMAGAPVSRLDVDGALVIVAGQVYPATQTTATIRATDSITILPNGTQPLPLSAGGTLTLSAPVITQGGTLRAPFGQIVLDASDTLTLAAGSITSVSGAGLVVPYGTIVDQSLWYGDDPNNPLTAPPEKRVTLKAPTVDMQAGAVVDLSGGGDLLAYQFVPGSGGSSDYLTYGNAVAILPIAMVSASAGQEIVHLDGGNGIPAGDYVVMPAGYALLPGAYRLEVVTSNGQPVYDIAGSARLLDGSVVVSGYGAVGGTDIRDQRRTAYKAAGRETIALRSEYEIWTANDYFSSDTFVETMRRQLGLEVTAVPRLPRDAGALQIQATLSATLDATLLGAAVDGGRGAAVDIAADKIAVVGGIDGTAYAASGYLVLDSSALSALGAESILLGGVRRQTASGLEIDPTATGVVVATDGSIANALAAPEILLAATDTVTITDGSLVEARGTVGTGSGDILITPVVAAVIDTRGTTDPSDDVVLTPARDYGALVRVSNGGSVGVVRDGAEQSAGTLAIGAATLRGNAVTLDATRTTTVAADATIVAEALDVASGRISIGAPTGTPDGLVLSGGSLGALAGARDLRLRSYSSIDFYGDVTLGTRSAGGGYALETLRLDAAAVTADARVDIVAGEVVFANTSDVTATTGAGTAGQLAVVAKTVVLDAGAKAFGGIGRVEVTADTAILGRGTGSADFGTADLVFSAPVLTAESGASQEWTTAGTFDFSGATNGAGIETLGARLAITAAAIRQAGLVDLTAGSVTLRATTGDVVLASGSVTRATGFTRTFFDQGADIAGGTISLVADHGEVTAQAGSLVDVSGRGAGAAGTLKIATPERTLHLDGEIRAGRGGGFELDTASLASFADLAAGLAAGGFDGALSVRLRTGDVILDGTTRASTFSLSTDVGSITVTGVVDASGSAGGTIRLAAQGDLTVASGARLLADASDADESSGTIALVAATGTMDLAAGATLSATGGRAGGGEIHLRFQRDDAAGTVKLASAAATMTARTIVAEAYRSYATTSVDASLPGALADAAAFMSAHAATIEAALGRAGDATFHLVPGVELASTGDLTLTAAVDLHGERTGGEAGVLTLRAAGNLVLNGSLSDGFSSAAASAEVLADTASWSYRLVGGADLAAADPLSVQPLGALAADTGSVRLGTDVRVRTGTGSIAVAAGRDVVLTDQTSVIYSAGARVADASLGGTYTGNVYDPVFTQGGGDVSVTAQNDVVTLTASDQMIVDWLWREGASDTGVPNAGDIGTGAFTENRQTAWWIRFSNFQQGIGALGGGDVTLTAGRDVVNVSAATPTQGRVGGGRTANEAKTVAITGGGDLRVQAGRDIVGGAYYVDGGSGTVAAGGAVTSNRTTNIHYDYSPDSYVIGEVVPIRTVLALGDADLTVTAGGSIDVLSASNPTLWAQSKDQVGTEYNAPRSAFSTYGESSSVTLLSVGGDVDVSVDAESLRVVTPAWSNYNSENGSSRAGAMTAFAYLPARTKVIAADGDVGLSAVTIYPAADGNIDIWARGSVELRSNIYLSPVALDFIGTVLRPLANAPSVTALVGLPTVDGGELFGTVRIGSRGDYRDGLLHADDDEPSRIYAVTGDITNGDPASSTSIVPAHFFAEQTWFRAGHDVVNLQARIQNNRASDLTLIAAGRDLNLGRGYITVDGPGFVLAEAGRDVFLGRGGGIETVGNGETPPAATAPAGSPVTYRNPDLPREGADLTVLAGTADDPRYDAFAAAYLDPANVSAMPSHLVKDGRPLYLDDLVAFMRQVTGDATLSEAAAFSAFQDPRYAEHRKILVERVLSAELKAAGRGQVDGLGPDGLGYERGYAAIATLFPGAEQAGGPGWQGDVIMDVSAIRTYRGGDLDIVAPGGILQVSALSSTATGERNGVLTINGGDIRIVTGEGTIINKSRVLTARGGDITV
ncbi:filamentous hemagglutinin N-terminal domain-containing protein [Rhodoplanes sp. TEM]|uniref:Filamentous hemagglutinin N-terminal domain-containing protein n=1 Tax=Rhodoplanes tepidamans TaxID=200616 RepID=A0ABT5JBP0_RHOTP|nr:MULTISPECIES: filamentous hemagglutinin N-terminal domain-containing protein [Rhodoplanes]MDC7787031.1 filamentous hemagglutinin N-terminal domain-containing protein [Rhodoplanes tepidamans]MDC7985271.1 filamentous hemagglutinin N-terminal domain-containing protein [Rhodoplanes sp. TEM]MDQ0354243.1 filamentous hemagglutinin family protein [Rhodoplanes tepidamans]